MSNPATTTGRGARLVLFLTVFIDLLGFGIMMPLLPLYARQYGASPQEVGLLVAVYSFTQFLFAPLWGSLSDRIGRRPVLLLSLAGSASAYVVFGLAPSLVWLFVSRGVAGIMAANIGAAQAYVADTTRDEDRAKGMGMIGAAFGLGFVFGPALGGIASHWGHQVPPFIAAGLSTLALLVALVRLPESRDPAGPARQASLDPLWRAFSNHRLASYMYAFLLLTIAFAAVETTLPLLLKEAPYEYDAQRNGYVFTYLGVLSALVQGGLIRRMAKGSNEARLAQIGAVFLAGGLALIPLARGLPGLLGSLLLVAMGQGFSQPTLMSLVSRATSQDEQGSVLGVAQSLASLGRIVGPPLGGRLFEVGTGIPYFASGVLMVLALGLVAAGARPAPAGSHPV